jgi:hypothetical protein
MSNENRRSFETQVRAAVSKFTETRRRGPTPEAFGAEATAAEVSPLAVARDRTAPSADRAAALHALAPTSRNDDEFIQALLSLVGDASEPPDLRAGVLRIIGQLRFSSVRLNERRADLIETLRPLIDEPDLTLRQDVLEMLAQEKDEYVQRRLLESLTSGAPLAGTLEKTVQLLGYDIHAEYFPILRQIAKTASTPEARREAVRLLASDVGSVDMLRDILRDKNEDQQVRRASANGYLSLDPQGFEKQAREIVFDQGDNDDVRAASLSALTHFAHPSVRDAALNEYVEKLEKDPLSKPLGEAVRTYQRRRGSD